MSRQRTTQVINSTDERFLDRIQHEVEEYRGLRTARYPGQLVIDLMDSEKQRRKQNRHKKKKKDPYEDYDAR